MNTEKQKTNTRLLAFRALSDVIHQGIFSGTVLSERVYKDTAMDDRDRRFAERLIKGVLENKVLLDGVIARKSSTPLGKIRPNILLILEIGTYEILFMKTEDHAILSEALKLTDKCRLSGLKGYVNAVLHGILRDRETAVDDLNDQEAMAIPAFLWNRFVSWYGYDETLRFTGFFRSPLAKRMTVRRNGSKIGEDAWLLKMAAEGIEAVPTGFTEDTYYLSGTVDFSASKSFSDGDFYVQDLSSSLAGDAVFDLFRGTEGKKRQIRVLDLCAAPGGKSLHIADMAGKNPDISLAVTALDVSSDKIEKIRENADRMGFSSIHAMIGDGTGCRKEFAEAFDLVILDAPCSGLGVLSGKPDIMLHTGKESLETVVKLQQLIFENAAKYVKNGGTLIYSTCTVNPDENENMRKWFLKENTEFMPVDFSGNLLNLPLSEKQRSMLKKGHLLILPGDLKSDGFYIARFRKSGKTEKT